MKKNYKIILFVVVFLIIGVASFGILNSGKKNKIDKILASESYSYLPKEAKNYIKEVYEETGEVILTEKNKEENVPYLNPQYVAYLQLSSEQKKNVSIIPNSYSVDYVFDNESSSQEFPKSYSLENVDGKNYTSPMYNQGGLGTCWAFATIENAESHLMIKKNEPRNENSTRFSVRQLDYAASTNGIKHYENPWGAAPLGLGGNFVYATTLMANGLSLVDDDYMPYVETLDEKPLYKVHNYSNSLYEVNSTVNLPNFGRIESVITEQCMDVDDWEACCDEKSKELQQEYINIIKEGVTNYGGIYVGAYDPKGQCGALNTDGYYVLDPNHTCFPMGSTAPAETGHAMQIIGWDDDYEYSYCRKATHSSTVDGTCTSGVLTQGTGAWLVKNSWGENNTEYIYLTYDSIQNNFVNFAYITSLSEMKDKNWDNVYNNGKISSKVTKKLTQTFEKKHNNKEKIQKIKFHTILMNQQYNISVQINGNIYSITDAYQTEYPGLYTVDVSDKNIFIESGNFDVIISGSEQSINNNSISVFTKNLDSEQLILTEEEKDIDSNKFTIYSETRNIPSNSEIIYELYNDIEKLENVMQVNNNVVAANNVNAEISLIKKLEPGTYRLVQKIGDVEATTSLNIGTILDGAGTLENPYKIYTEEDLKYIHNHLDSHYELERDIELTKEWVPIGTNETPFTGSFDGKNHKIINLQINDSTLKYAGLFGYVKDSNEYQTYIKNIYLVNPNIVAKQYVGGLVGGININQTGERTALIDSIYIIGGSIEGEFANGLVADISGYKKLIINNIFSSATIKGKSHSSLIRFSSNQYNSNNGTSISNIENIGVMLDNNLSYYKTSLISANYSYYYNISNYISTGYSKKITSLNQFYDTPIHDIDYNYSNNGYTLSRSDSTYEFPNIIKKVSNITELKNINKYSEWGEDFNSYWKIDEVDGIKRIPILKGVGLDYTDSISDINIEFGNDISLSDYISSEFITRRLKVTTDNDDIIKISEKYNNSEAYPYEIIISPLKSGTATMHVVSDYDGYENDININVVGSKNCKVHFNSNFDNKTEIIQEVSEDTKFVLNENTFERKGYKFKGWNTKSDGTGISYINKQETIINADLTLYAQWEPINYKVVFYANSGMGWPYEEKFTYDIEKTLPKCTFTKKSYSFIGWNTELDGTGESYEDEKQVLNLISENDGVFELYAQWKPIKYTLRFNSNTGVGTMNDIKLNYDESKKIPANTFTKEGYVFVGWNTKADGTGISYSNNEEVLNLSSTENDVINLYAIWEKENATITFNANGGEGNMYKIDAKVNENVALSGNMFTKTGYKFKGWNTKQDGTGINYDDKQNIVVKDNVSLYAQWTPINYSLFLSDGIGNNKTQELTYDKEEKIAKNDFVKKGYVFTEWNTKQDGTGTKYSDEQIINNLSTEENDIIPLYAQWTPISYKIIFYANGGMGWPYEEKFTYDVEKTLPKCTFTREGYSFIGWNTELDGSGQLYSSGRKVLNLIDENDGVFELYAQWVKNDNTIINNTKDYEGFYDEKEHSIDLNIEPSDYNIKYSINNTNYDLDELPKFKEVGEYTVNYKITKDGYEDLTGSNKVKIYGIRKLGDGISLKNDILITDNNKFVDVINNIDTYSKVTEFFHYDKDKKLVDDIVKTGDFIDVNINNSKSYLYKVSLLGDVNGDGKITSADYVKIRKHIMQTELIKDNLYFYSADVNDDNKISSADYVKIRKYIMNGESL